MHLGTRALRAPDHAFYICGLTRESSTKATDCSKFNQEIGDRIPEMSYGLQGAYIRCTTSGCDPWIWATCWNNSNKACAPCHQNWESLWESSRGSWQWMAVCKPQKAWLRKPGRGSPRHFPKALSRALNMFPEEAKDQNQGKRMSLSTRISRGRNWVTQNQIIRIGEHYRSGRHLAA